MLFKCFYVIKGPSIYRPISILLIAYLPEHYKIETGSGSRLVIVRIGGQCPVCPNTSYFN